MSRRKRMKADLEEKIKQDDLKPDITDKIKPVIMDKKPSVSGSSKNSKKEFKKEKDLKKEEIKKDKEEDKKKDVDNESELDDPIIKELFTGLEGAAFQSRMPFDKLTSTEAACFPDIAQLHYKQ
ncbi:unnamed protein product [Brassicogethes aeneus]|uniref:Uncharacterized protein n=1 Tax=Brassicogethes aeneus TaxID=1431903 RepID=A0A9P0FG88_BRAAE|nr:unnamed protein product [Brassicogethes aeneus]